MLLLLLLLQTATAQTGSIAGIVYDASTGEMLIGAAVFVEPGPVGDATDEKGRFVIADLPPGPYTVHVQYLGYVSAARAGIEVLSGRVTRIEVGLEQHVLAANEVVVEADLFYREREEAGAMMVYDTEAVRSGAGTAGDVLRLLAGQPSAARTDDMRNALAVRGGSPMENRFLVDGIVVPNLNHFPTQGSTGGAISVVSPDLVESVSFRPGGMGAEHFDRLSSQVGLNLKNPAPNKGLIDLGLAGMGVLVETSGEKSGLMLSLRRSWVDLLVNRFLEEQADAVPEYSDLVLKGTWRAEEHRLNVLAIGLLDRSGISREGAIDANENMYGDADYSNSTVGMRWRWLWGVRGFSETAVSHSGGLQSASLRRTVDDEAVLVGRSREDRVYLLHTTHFRIGPRHRAKLGFDAEAEWTASASRRRGGVHSSVSMRGSKGATVTTGVRVDRYPGAWLLQPRASVEWTAGPVRSWVTSGHYVQALPLSLARDRVSTARHATIGGAVNLRQDVLATLEVYSKRYRKQPVDPSQPWFFLLDEMHDEALSLPVWPDFSNVEYDGRARAHGMEASVRKALTAGVSGVASAGWSRTEYLAEEQWLPRRFDSQWVMTIDGGWRITTQHSVSMRWTFASGQPYTPVDREASIAAGTQVRRADAVMSKRLSAYHSLSVRYDLRVDVGKRQLIAYASVWNAYNRRNVLGEYWDSNSATVRERLQWGLLPVIGLKLAL